MKIAFSLVRICLNSSVAHSCLVLHYLISSLSRVRSICHEFWVWVETFSNQKNMADRAAVPSCSALFAPAANSCLLEEFSSCEDVLVGEFSNVCNDTKSISSIQLNTELSCCGLSMWQLSTCANSSVRFRIVSKLKGLKKVLTPVCFQQVTAVSENSSPPEK